MTTSEYVSPRTVQAPGACFVEHRMKRPRVADTAYVAPNAVLCGDVTIGAHSRVLFGAVITAEGGPVTIGEHCVIMENAVIRGVAAHPTVLGDHVLVGPHAHLSGCVIEGESRIATGGIVFNGARLGRGAEVEFHAVVGVNTVVPAGMAVPMGHFAGGDPAEVVPPGDWNRIKALLGPLDYPGTVFGVGENDRTMPDIARRYSKGLAVHHRDHLLNDGQH